MHEKKPLKPESTLDDEILPPLAKKEDVEQKKENESNNDEDYDLLEMSNKSLELEGNSGSEVSNIIKHFLSLVRSKGITIDRMYGVHLTALGELENRVRWRCDD